MASKAGTNPNAKPFVPSFLATPSSNNATATATTSAAPVTSPPPPRPTSSFSAGAAPFIPGGALRGPYLNGSSGGPTTSSSSSSNGGLLYPNHPSSYSSQQQQPPTMMGMMPPPPLQAGGGPYFPLPNNRPSSANGMMMGPSFAPGPVLHGGGLPIPPPASHHPPGGFMPPPSMFQHAGGVPRSTVLAMRQQQQQQQQQPTADAVAPASESQSGWTVVMFLGPRGSGKSTQGQLLAKKHNLLFVSAGDLMRAEKQPFLALHDIVKQEFAGKDPSTATYKGLALDRFIVSGDCDAYYLQWALSAAPNMPVPFVFLLMIDFEVAQKRADARESDQRPKSLQRRMLEHRAQFDACENVYAPIQCLRRIECDDMTADGIHSIVIAQMKVLQSSPNCGRVPADRLPKPSLHPSLPSAIMVSNVETFLKLKVDTHAAIDSTLIHHAPASHMSGVVDGGLAEDRKLRTYFATCWVTLKADGQRLILVKHRSLGLFGFPFAFTACYNFSDYLSEVVWPSPPPEWNPKSSEVEFILDCEVIQRPETKRAELFIFDAIFYYGHKGKTTIFSKRLELLTAGFSTLPKDGVVHLKQYGLVKDLPQMLPDYHNPPFPIDGVIFQPDSFYVYGKDKHLYKWKPAEQCTVDFRLYAGEEPATPGGEWVFEAKVQATKVSSGVEEISMPNVQIRIPDATVIKEGLSDGAIVECIRLEEKQPKKEGKTGVEVWSFYRTRREKVYPNQEEIALTIAKMKPLSYKQLIAFAESVKK